jgi:TetR/AcrR family transcriptional regulator, transcriptional repressor for nem operon
MRYPGTHKEETRKKLIGSARTIAKRGGFGTTGVDELMASIGLTGGAFYGHFPSKEALFAELVEQEISNSVDMLAGDESSPPDHVAKRLRSYLSSYHAVHPETGCVLPALGPELARAGPEVRAAVEQGLKRFQKSWSRRFIDQTHALDGAPAKPSKAS